MRQLVRTLSISVTSLLFCFCAATLTRADTVTLTNTDSGWYDNSGAHDSTNKNYFAGNFVLRPLFNNFNHNFFVFNLSGVSGTITSAQIRLYAAVVNGTGPYTLFNVSTPVSELSASQTGRTDIFDDLSTGVSYGSTTITPADFGTIITIDLNAAAITALQNSSGSFAVGGFFDTAPETFAFAVSEDAFPDPRNQLILQTRSAVPEPTTMLLLGTGLAGVALKIRRRRLAGKSDSALR